MKHLAQKTEHLLHLTNSQATVLAESAELKVDVIATENVCYCDQLKLPL